MGLRGLVAAALALVITGCSATSASERTNTATNTATSPTGNQAGSGAFIAASATTLDLDQLDDVLVAELQTFRTTQGMATLKRDAQLDAAAQALATVMARKNDLSHSADGQRAGDRIEDAGYVLCTQGAPWAENIARSSQFGTTADLANTIMTGWINSPGHRKNMVGAFAEVGLAVAETSDGSRVYAAQVFATPGRGRCL